MWCSWTASHGFDTVFAVMEASKQPSKRRVVAVALAALCMFSGIGAAFWYQDLQYSRPTPKPAALKEPPLGAPIAFEPWLTNVLSSDGKREVELDVRDRPVLLHFFNPSCPCSRFNITHLRTLQQRFGDRVAFVGAVQTYEEGTLTPEQRADVAKKMASLDLGIDWFVDVGGKLAALAGVYSTPQAVLTDRAHRLVYRGNYNVSRYCTDPKTEFVRIALEKLVTDNPSLSLISSPGATSPAGAIAMPAYGCELPSNVQASK
jgi:hypothetical protein